MIPEGASFFDGCARTTSVALLTSDNLAIRRCLWASTRESRTNRSSRRSHRRPLLVELLARCLMVTVAYYWLAASFARHFGRKRRTPLSERFSRWCQPKKDLFFNLNTQHSAQHAMEPKNDLHFDLIPNLQYATRRTKCYAGRAIVRNDHKAHNPSRNETRSKQRRREAGGPHTTTKQEENTILDPSRRFLGTK